MVQHNRLPLFVFYGENSMDLRELRFKKQISQWELSKISGVHQSRISLIEKGFPATRKEQNLLSKALGINAEVILWPNINEAQA
jgi:transcriptional regulator with XRE-family HTH domain